LHLPQALPLASPAACFFYPFFPSPSYAFQSNVASDNHVITFTRDKSFAQIDTGQRKMEGDTTIGGVWKPPNIVLATIRWDFVPWPHCSYEKDPKQNLP
jgi:hypothetical protein